MNGEGGKIGPELSALGTAQPVDFIVGAILDPQKEVKEGYVSISITTKDGEEYQGYQVRETATEIVLRDILQNKEIRLRRGLALPVLLGAAEQKIEKAFGGRNARRKRA